MIWSRVIEEAICALEPESIDNETAQLSELITNSMLEADNDFIGKILASSQHDARAFHSLHSAVVDHLKAGRALPCVLNGWVANVLSGAVKSPPPERRDFRGNPGDNLSRDLHLHRAVTVIHQKFGLSIYQNDEVQEERSSISAVAEAMRLLGMRPASYSGVKKAYREIENEYRAGRRPDIGAAIPGWIIDN